MGEKYAEEISERINAEKETSTSKEQQGTEYLSNEIMDYSLRCIKGPHKNRFVYINLTPEGEVIGGDPKDESLTLYIENSNLDDRHAQVFFKNGVYYAKDLGSSTGTWLKQGNLDPICITDGLEISIGNETFQFRYSSRHLLLRTDRGPLARVVLQVQPRQPD